MSNYLVEGFQELKGGGLLAILVEDLVEPRHNLALPETCCHPSPRNLLLTNDLSK
jgi:hypothetical protein